MAARAYDISQRVPPTCPVPGLECRPTVGALRVGQTASGTGLRPPEQQRPRIAAPRERVASAALGVAGAEHPGRPERRERAHPERQLRHRPPVQWQPPRFEGPFERRPDFGVREPTGFAPRAGGRPPPPVIGQREKPGPELGQRTLASSCDPEGGCPLTRRARVTCGRV